MKKGRFSIAKPDTLLNGGYVIRGNWIYLSTDEAYKIVSVKKYKTLKLKYGGKTFKFNYFHV